MVLNHATLRRHNVHVVGNGTRPMLWVHGFGCNQAMWRDMISYFESSYRIYLFDHIGTADTGREGWDPKAYSRLTRYAEDVVDVAKLLDLRDLILVGHSVSAIICGLASKQLGDRIAGLVMISPSPRYINDGEYVGGFEIADVEGLLESIEGNYIGWSQAMAPAIMGRPDAPHFGEELTARFCEQDPEVGVVFARATFTSDNRADLVDFDVPALVLQCHDDLVAPISVGKYVASQLPQGTFCQLNARGHCPNLSAPKETATAILNWLDSTHV